MEEVFGKKSNNNVRAHTKREAQECRDRLEVLHGDRNKILADIDVLLKKIQKGNRLHPTQDEDLHDLEQLTRLQDERIKLEEVIAREENGLAHISQTPKE
ncbi:MAG: hypothetical protein KGI50_01015 [Patescibacteria group bacterium]|nr:hypothetical protein [Patescibacteria group bacterium]MDE2438068.1 hypothetical protein [Patescibacteria group bacterium]